MRCHLEINLNNLEKNINKLNQKIDKDKMIAVLKANAYGHGSKKIFKELLKLGIKYFAVATFEEAMEIYKINKEVDILILSTIERQKYKLIENTNIRITIDNVKDLEYIYIHKLKNKIHIKLNTGMTRLGFTKENIDLIDKYIDILNIEAIFSHLSSVDIDALYTQKQLNLFDEITCRYNLKKHILSSKGLEKYHNTKYIYDYVRLGISIYGGIDGYHNLMSFYSKVCSIIEIDEDTFVGYDKNYEISKGEYIATVSVGYADGYKRILSNKARVYINNKSYNVVGNICMDLFMVKVDKSVKINDRVELFGDNINITEIAELADTINYEIMATIGKRVELIYKGVK